ncbi:MAG: glycosyltransferase family 9 protein [Armatimonadota bacterium]
MTVKATAPDPHNRILIIRLSNFIGDVVVMTPVVSALRQRYPNAHIAVLADMPGAEVLRGHPDINELIVYRQTGRYHQKVRGQFSEHFAVLNAVRRGNFDLAINLHPSERGAIAARLSGASVRVGFTRPPYNDFVYRLFYNQLVRIDTVGRNASDQLLDTVRAIGVPVNSIQASLGITKEETLEAQSLLAGLKRPLLGIHTGSGGFHKSWTARGWTGLLNKLHQRYGGSVVILGSGTESEFIRDIQRTLDFPAMDLTGELGLKQTAAVVKETDVIIAIDSALLHIAAAVGCPTVALFGPTDDARWNPAGEDHIVVRSGHPDCGNPGCCTSLPSACMQQIQPVDVLLAVEKLYPQMASTQDNASAG